MNVPHESEQGHEHIPTPAEVYKLVESLGVDRNAVATALREIRGERLAALFLQGLAETLEQEGTRPYAYDLSRYNFRGDYAIRKHEDALSADLGFNPSALDVAFGVVAHSAQVADDWAELSKIGLNAGPRLLSERLEPWETVYEQLSQQQQQ